MEPRYRIKVIPGDGSVACYSARSMPKSVADELAAKTKIDGFSHEVVEDTESLNGRYTVAGEVITDAGPKYQAAYEGIELLLEELTGKSSYTEAIEFLDKFYKTWEEEYHTVPFKREYIVKKLEEHFRKVTPSEELNADMTDEEMLKILEERFWHTPEEIVAMVCPVCGKHTITFSEFRQYATLCESEVDHCDDPNWVPPFRPALACSNVGCLTHGKGYWTDVELDFRRYRAGDAKLIGEPLGYSDHVPDIFNKRGVSALRHENYEYRNGQYIGPNKVSKAVKWYHDTVGGKIYSIKYRSMRLANKHLGANYWTGLEHLETPVRSKLGEYLFGLRKKSQKEDTAE